MAATKIYTVVKDGEEIEKLKTLTAAKKLADTEGAEVYADGKCVYSADITEETEESTPAEDRKQAEDEKTSDLKEQTIITAEPVISKKPVQPETGPVTTERYRLKLLMNVRKAPALDAAILGTRAEGTVVRVLAIEGDWMHLSDGSYILYEGGKYAEKIV